MKTSRTDLYVLKGQQFPLVVDICTYFYSLYLILYEHSLSAENAIMLTHIEQQFTMVLSLIFKATGITMSLN